MKGFFVADRRNEIHFIDSDKEFCRYVNQQAKERGLLQEDANINQDMDPNVVMQQFSPLIMSQWFMIDQAKNPYSSITTENGFIFVFKQYEDYLLIAISGDQTETEDYLVRKCLVFTRLISFYFGPVIEEIGRPRFCRKKERWLFLKGILSTWNFLSSTEQSFLMEAVERLHVNQMVNEQCIELLQMAINKLQAAGEKNCQHALLLVNTKLLALYSNRNAHELNAADILCIVVLVRHLFPNKEKLEDLFAQSFRFPNMSEEGARTPAAMKVYVPLGENYESAREGLTDSYQTEDDLEQYHSAYESPMNGKKRGNTPNGGRRSARFYLDSSPEGGRARTPYPEVSESFHTPTQSPLLEQKEQLGDTEPTQGTQGTDKSLSVEINRGSPGRSRRHSDSEVRLTISNSGQEDTDPGSGQGRGRSRSYLEPKPRAGSLLCSERSHSDTQSDRGTPEPSSPTEADYDCVKQPVFLSIPICRYAPYQIHCQRIFPGIVLVVLSETPKSDKAAVLVQMLELLKDLVNGRKDTVNRSQGQLLYDVIHSSLSKVLSSLKKSKGHMEQLCGDVKRKWESEDLKASLLSYLEQGAGEDIPPGLERSLKSLHSKFMEMFQYLYLSPRSVPVSDMMKQAMLEVQQRIVMKLSDYKDYLMVKAQRNITMTSYIEEFPGLVHFIYVNRRTNQITAPALNITHPGADGARQDATQLLKDKIWVMSEWMLNKLHAGYTSVMAREGDYHFSYFLWFEECSGDPIPVQKAFKGDDTAPPPGVLTGNFYKYLIHKCFPNSVPGQVHCNELIMMHVGLAHTQYIANQCRQLAAVMWETSGDAYTPMNLL